MVIRKSLLSLSIASVFALTACGSDNDKKPTPEPPVPPPVVVVPETPDAISFVVNGNVVNAANSDLVPATISFFENGVAATNLVDINGAAVTSIESAAGDFSVTTKEGSTATLVTATVTAEGYISKSFVVDLNVAEGTSVLPVQFALVSKDAEGVADTTETAVVADGTVAEEIKAVAEAGSASAEVTIPASTVLQDADGNTITGTDISLNVTSSEKASTIVPEGLNAADATEVAVPVGVASVLMVDENGTKIKKFSDEIGITVNVPASSGVVEGEMLSVSSHNEDTGVWAAEDGKATVGALNATTNTFPATFMTDHLTVFTTTKNTAACVAGIKVNYTGSDDRDSLFISITSDDYNSGDVAVADAEQQFVGLNTKVAANAKARVVVKDINGSVRFDSGNEVAICSDTDDVNVVLAESTDTLVSETFNIDGQCTNNTDLTFDLTGALVTYQLEGKGVVKALETETGYALTNLISGSTYQVNVTLTGDKFKATSVAPVSITADGTDENAPLVQITCDTSTGGTGAT